MDIENNDAVFTDTADIEIYQEPSFGAQVGKAFAVSAIASVGTVVGFLAAGYAIGKFEEIKKKRAAKRDAALTTTEDPTVTDA